jgi:AcrR family transcriptional regulator
VSTAIASLLHSSPHKSPGRPRSDSVRRSILSATLQLLDEVGYAKLTVEGVAALAQAGKATIYRWWSNKARLVGEALMEETDPQLPFPDTGSVREDFRRQLQLVAQLFNSPKGKRLAMIIGVAQEEPEMLESFRSNFLAARRTEAVQILQRGVRRGELRGEVFSEVAVDALYGPLYFRLLIEHGTLSPDYVDALCDLVMTGLVRRSN